MASMIDPASALQSPVGAEHPTLLIVDDSRLMRHALKKILSADFNLVEAADGEEAWEKLQAEPGIQAIFSDLSMPNLDGYGLLERVRKSAEARINNLPFIVITGKEGDDTSLRAEAQALGANEIVCKPFKSEEIIGMTNRFLATDEQGGAETEALRLAEEAEAQRQAEETTRLAVEEEARRIAAEAESQRQAEETARLAEADAQRIAEEANAQRLAEENVRLAIEQEARRIAAEAEAQRQAEESARLAAEADAQRIAEETARVTAEAEARHIAAEAEAQRQAEESARQAAEAEAQRIAEEARAQRLAEETARVAAEAEARRIAAEVEAQRQAAEAARVAAEQEARRIAAETEAQRLAEETARAAADTQRAVEAASQQPVQEELFAAEALEEAQLAVEGTAELAANDTESDYATAAVAEAASYTELPDTDDDLFDTAAAEPQRFPLLTRTCIRLAMPAMRLANRLMRLNKDKQLAALRERL